MGLFTNVGGQLKELSSLTTTVGGELKEINSLTANIGGQPKEIFTMLPKNITGTWHKTTGTSFDSTISKSDAHYPNTDVTKYFTISSLKFPIHHNIKVKITINITDGYLYKQLSSNKKLIHGVSVALGYKTGSVGFMSVVGAGSELIVETKTTYTVEKTIPISAEHYNLDIVMNRWVAEVTNLDTANETRNYYNNNLLSFDYSIEFELV